MASPSIQRSRSTRPVAEISIARPATNHKSARILAEAPEGRASLPPLRHGPQNNLCGNGGSAEGADYACANRRILYARAKAVADQQRHARARSASRQGGRRSLSPCIRVSRRCSTTRGALRRVLLESDRHGFVGHPFCRRTGRDRPGRPRRRSTLWHRGPPDTRDRSRARQRSRHGNGGLGDQEPRSRGPGIGMDFDEVPIRPNCLPMRIDVHGTPVCA